MKNICFFIGDVTRSGGTERVTLQVAGELAKSDAKYSIHIISLVEISKTSFYTIPEGVKTNKLLNIRPKPIKRAILFYLPILFRLIRFIRQKKIDLLIDVDGILDIFSIPAKILTNIKIVTWEHFNFYADMGSMFRPFVRKLSARFSDAIVTITEEDREYYTQNLKLKAPVRQIYNPMCMEYTGTYDINSKIIFSAGRLTSQKGFDMLLDVAKIVLDRHADWVWMIAGDGEEHDALTKKIQMLGLEGRVCLVGNVNNIDEYFASAGMFVLTSRYEGFGLVIAEAKKYKLPVVSFACKAGPKELILDGQNGYLVKCFDISEMAERISELIQDKELRILFSNHSWDDVEKISYGEVIKKWDNLFGSLLC